MVGPYVSMCQDPYEQGQIAAANVLSDMYSVGVSHVDNVLMVLTASMDMEPSDRRIVTLLMMKGFNDLGAKASLYQEPGGKE